MYPEMPSPGVSVGTSCWAGLTDSWACGLIMWAALSEWTNREINGLQTDASHSVRQEYLSEWRQVTLYYYIYIVLSGASQPEIKA